MSLNTVNIMGRIATSPDLRYTRSETPVMSFRVAVDNDMSGDSKKTYFFSVTAWRGLAEFISRYFTKGSLIVIQGHLQTSEYTDKNGSKRIDTEIVAEHVYFAGGKQEGEKRAVTPVNVKADDFEELDDDGPLPWE